MTLQQLNYLVTVADCGNITETAEKLYFRRTFWHLDFMWGLEGVAI